MKFYVLKSRHLFIFFAVLIFLGVTFGHIASTPVFKVGNREIPIYSVKREDNAIALTFNCAWGDEDIDTILNTLKQYDVRSTFFIVGTWAEKYPEAVKKIFDNGHEIANHSYNHDHYSDWSKEQIISDIEKCDNLLFNITGTKPTLFRAAYGEYNDNVVAACEENGRFYIQWSVDSLDYGDAETDAIIERVTKKAKSGDIILMHTGTKNTKNALPKILDTLTKEYSLIKASDLIYKENYTIDSQGTQIKK